MMRLSLFTIFLTLTAMPLLTHAQSFASPLSPGNDPIVTMNPEHPEANQSVTMSVVTYGTDIKRAEVSWYLGGALKKRGIGATTFSFETGSNGTASTVNVTIKALNGETFSKNIVIRPAEVDLLWEANTYAPPFYKGKALPTSESEIRVVAMPNLSAGSGAAQNPATLVYQWQKNFKNTADVSGYGARSATFKGSGLYDEDGNVIKVTASTLDGKITADSLIVIPVETPRVIFYEETPLGGTVYENALGDTFNLTKEEMVVRAEPYFFSTKDLGNSKTRYTWTLNGGQMTSDSDNQNLTTLRRDPRSSGVSSIALTINNLSKLLQFSETATAIQFNAIQ